MAARRDPHAGVEIVAPRGTARSAGPRTTSDFSCGLGRRGVDSPHALTKEGELILNVIFGLDGRASSLTHIISTKLLVFKKQCMLVGKDTRWGAIAASQLLF